MSGATASRSLARLADGVLCQGAADEAVLLDLDRGTYFALNAVAARMLELALELPDAGAVVEVLAEEYEAEADVLRSDLARLLSELSRHALLAADDGP